MANALLTPNGGRGGIGVGAIAFDARQSDVIQYGDKTGPLDTCGFTMGVAFEENFHAAREVDTAPSMTTEGYRVSQNAGGLGLRSGMQVRRLTPTECERLQGFPDDYTLIPYRGKPAADGPRYKALGNSWAVPVVRWVGQRIEALQ